MSEDKLLTRRQILGIFGATTGAAIVGTGQADLGQNEQRNLYGGTANMAGAYQVGPGLWKGPLSVRSEVPAEDGNDFIQTDAGDDGNLYAMHHYNGGWDKQGVKVTSLEADQVRVKQLGQYLLQERDFISDSAVARTADPVNDAVTITYKGVDFDVWVPDIPWNIAHEFYIDIPDGDYSGIHMFVPPYTLADVVGFDDQGAGGKEGASQVPWIRGNITTPTNVKFESVSLSGTQGAIAPIIEGINPVGVTPFDDETTGVNIFGCQNVSFRHISFVGSTASRGFVPYSSGVTLRGGIDFGSDDLQYGVETKHNANVNLDDYDGQITGTVTDYVLYNMDGSIVSHFNVGATGGMGFIHPNSEGLVYNGNTRELEPVSGVHVRGSIDQTVSSNTTTTLQFDTAGSGETYDRNGDFDTTNCKFVVPVNGRYQIDLQIQWIGPSDTTELDCRIEDITNNEAVMSGRFSGSVATNPTQDLSGARELDAGQELAVKVTHDEAADLDVNINSGALSWWTINKIN